VSELVTRKSQHQIDPGASVALDIARFLLALCVAGSHWTQRYFQDNWPDVLPLAIGAVGAFFVLSGFTIRLITAGSPFRLDDYLVKRLARLWSVALPALLVTAVLDSTSALVNPDFYLANWGTEELPLLRLLANATFFSQVWGLDIVPQSNSPFWSIGYEAWFYVLYGLVLARKPLWAAGMALLAGPNIWFLLPLWACGIGVYEILARARTRAQLVALLCTALALSVLTVGALATYRNDIRQSYDQILSAYFGFFHVSRSRVGIGSMLPAAGVTFALVMVALLAAIKLAPPRVPGTIVKTARWLGEFTFPLYLLHVPLFVLCAALGFYDRHSSLQKIATFAGVCLVISCAVPLTDRIKRALQSGLSRLTSGVIDRGVQPSRLGAHRD
jgi:peptidoglycan/LPS O-acetylase OafA/YrhL